MKGDRYYFKKLFAVLLMVCVTCSVSPWALRTGHFVYGLSVDELGDLEDGTFYVRTAISDWNDLTPILALAPETVSRIVIDGNNGGAILAEDLSKFAKLGQGLSTDTLPTIIDSGNTSYAARILPDYNPTAATGAKFEQGLQVRHPANHSLQDHYEWSGVLTYVLPTDGSALEEPVIKVVHDVTADVAGENVSLLQYADTVGSGVVLDVEDYEDNVLEMYFWDDLYMAEATYQGALRYIDYNGNNKNVNLTYSYYLTEQLLGTLAAPDAEDILGTVRIKALKNSAAEADVEFNMYTDAACTIPAEAYDAESASWQAIGAVKTGTDGSIELKNIKSGTYYVKRTSNSEVQSVTLSASTKSIVLAGGEGDSAFVNKADLLLNPEWQTNAKSVMSYANLTVEANADERDASYYGGDIFTLSEGTPVTASVKNSSGTVETTQTLEESNLTELGDCTVRRNTESAPDETSGTLAEAIEYINTNLLGTGHYIMTQKYLDKDLVAELEFTTEDTPPVPPVEPPVEPPVGPPEWPPYVPPIIGPVDPTPVVDPVEEPTEPTPAVDPAEDPAEDPADEDVDDVVDDEADDVDTEDDDNPVGTGDARRLWLWLTCLAASLCALRKGCRA